MTGSSVTLEQLLSAERTENRKVLEANARLYAKLELATTRCGRLLDEVALLRAEVAKLRGSEAP